MTHRLRCSAGMGTHLGTLMAAQVTKTRNLLLKAPISQGLEGSTSKNMPRQVARAPWYKAGGLQGGRLVTFRLAAPAWVGGGAGPTLVRMLPWIQVHC